MAIWYNYETELQRAFNAFKAFDKSFLFVLSRQ